MDGPEAGEDAMTTTKKNTTKTFTLVGAGAGLAAFLAVGLLPSILYGGYGGRAPGRRIFGTRWTPPSPSAPSSSAAWWSASPRWPPSSRSPARSSGPPSPP